MTQVQRQRIGQHGGQLAAEQHLLDAVGRGAAFDVADKVALQRAVVVADIQRHQSFHRPRGLNGERRTPGLLELQANVIPSLGHRGSPPIDSTLCSFMLIRCSPNRRPVSTAWFQSRSVPWAGRWNRRSQPQRSPRPAREQTVRPRLCRYGVSRKRRIIFCTSSRARTLGRTDNMARTQ